jgi:transcriptional regulator with XRE-family HTH domain
MDFNKRVADLCKYRGIQKKDLANILGITPTGLAKAINQQYPQLQTLERIAKALDVELSELFADNTIYCPHCGKKIKIEKGE